jgi:Protein of unknown function (DUF2799)
MPAKTVGLVCFLAVSGCASFSDPDPSNLAAYCTAETGYRVGYLARAYYGVCPKETEAAFLSGLQRGRGFRANPPQAMPYFDRMERTEKQLLAASGAERERLTAQLRQVEQLALHVVNDPASYTNGR